MPSPDLFLFGSYDLTLATLSVLISLLASHAASSLSERVRDAHGREWITWLIAGATVDGIGTWAMHYTGMLAFQPPVPLYYHWPTVLLSFLLGVIGSASAMLVLGKGSVGIVRSAVAAVLLGAVGISSVYYTAMAALKIPGIHVYEPAYVVVAVSLAIIIVFGSFVLGHFAGINAHRSRLESRIGVLLRGSANPVMHFTAMAGVTFFLTGEPSHLSNLVSISSLGVLAISIVPIMVLIVNLLTSLLDKLRKQKALLDELFEQAPEAVALMNKDNRVIRVNREFTRIFGYTEKESRNRQIRDLIITKDKKDLLSNETVEKSEPLEEETIRYHKDGTPLRVSIVRVPVSGRRGQIASYAIYTDMTEQKRTEALLEESELRFRAFMENIPGHTWIKDTQFRYVFMSESTAATTIKPHDWRGRTDEELFPPRVVAQFRANDKKVMTTGAVLQTFESYFWGGQEHYLAVSKFPILDHSGKVALIAGVSIDISERLQAEEALKNSYQQLRTLSARLQTIREEETTRIAREIHDDLGSALTSLKWDLEFLDRRVSDQSRPIDLETVRKDLKSMTRLVDTTINGIRRISAELRPGVLDDLGLDAAIEWQARQFQTRTGIVCLYKISDKIELNREQSTAVFRILQETLTNIIRHANATRVSIDMRLESDDLVLTIRDNGRGITESQKSGQNAIGILGMRERAHLIGGRIDIKGTNGRGTVVTLRVPLFQMERVSKAG